MAILQASCLLHSYHLPAASDLPGAFTSSFISNLEQPGRAFSDSACCICLSDLVPRQTYQPQRNTGFQLSTAGHQHHSVPASCFPLNVFFPLRFLVNFINTSTFFKKKFPFLLLSYSLQGNKTKIKKAKSSASQGSLSYCYTFACS